MNDAAKRPLQLTVTCDSPTGGQISNDPATCTHPPEWRDQGLCRLCGTVVVIQRAVPNP